MPVARNNIRELNTDWRENECIDVVVRTPPGRARKGLE